MSILTHVCIHKYSDQTEAMENVERQRCQWAQGNELYREYHDLEWGIPVREDRLLFEFLILEGAQAGLSWLTILQRRANYRFDLDNFDARKLSRYVVRTT